MSSAIGNRGKGIRISTTEKLKTEPGVSCAKIRIQTVEQRVVMINKKYYKKLDSFSYLLNELRNKI